MDSVEKVLVVAGAMEGFAEQPKNSNKGQVVEAFLKVTGTAPGEPWCAAFVAWVGVKACGQYWPLPKTAGCQALYTWGKANNAIALDPRRGDLFLLYFPNLRRYAHVGFVEDVGVGAIKTIEGNTGPDGSREGYCVARRTRAVSDRMAFLRWAA